MSRQADPDYPFTTGQNWAIALVCIFGAFLIAIPSEFDFAGDGWVALVGVAIEAGLLVVVLTVAFAGGFTIPGVPRRGSGGRFRPLPFLGFCAFAVIATWYAYDAARGATS